MNKVITKENWEFLTCEVWWAHSENIESVYEEINFYGDHVWVSRVAAESLRLLEPAIWLSGGADMYITYGEMLEWYNEIADKRGLEGARSQLLATRPTV